MHDLIFVVSEPDIATISKPVCITTNYELARDKIGYLHDYCELYLLENKED